MSHTTTNELSAQPSNPGVSLGDLEGCVMWNYLIEHSPSGGAVKDYSLAGVLTTAPLWAGYLTHVNALLTFAGLVVGLWLGVRRLIRDYQRGKDD